MATYSQFNLERNRHTGQSTQQLKKNLIVWLEISLKWTVDFVSEMVRLIRGK